jgi:tRNA-2-methylthio-N6-dimethylallyladenosine synthase
LKKKYYIQTFGCQMNVHDSEQIAALLTSAGYERTNNAVSADYIILNTCSIREKAAQKAYSQLGRFRGLKRKNSRLVIGVGGCLAQQWGEKFFKKAPYLDIVFGTRNFHRLPELINAVETTCLPVVETALDESPESAAAVTAMPQNGQVSAYVTIMQGCDNFCAYCVVPYLRGREESRKPDDIIAEVERLAAHGIKEVTLLGQNVNSYGKGLLKGTDFAGVLRRVGKIRGIERIRFTTSHPKDLSLELIRCYAEVDKLCEHIHLPVQSGSDQVLRRMNRGYNREEYMEKVARLREVCPDISITSDMIVGFPGETDEDFQESIDLMKNIRFDNLFSFKYSERYGTAAADFDGKVGERIKGERLQILQSLQETHTLEKNKKMEGQVMDVLVEGRSKNSSGEAMGRTRTNKIVNLKGSPALIGKTTPVVITLAYQHSLRGELLSKKEVDRC